MHRAVSLTKAGLAAGALLLLAACDQQPVVDVQTASTLNIVEVNVDAAKASSAAIRGFDASEQSIEQLFDQALTYDLQKRPRGARRVIADVSLDSVFLPNPAAGLVFGSNYPQAKSVVQLRDAASNTPIGAPTTVLTSGFEATGGELRIGILGAAMQRGQEQELRALATAVATDIGNAIFGK